MRKLIILAMLAAVTAGQASAQTASPAAPVATAPSAAATLAADRNFVIFFPEWSAAIDDAAQRVIAAAAKVAAINPTDPVTVTGFADPTGSARSNALVSALRAEQVYSALVDAGVAGERIQRVALGGTDFVFTPQESRRVTIAVGAK